MTPQERAAIAYLRTPQAIRDRAGQLFELAQADRLDHFACDLTQLDAVADYVVETTRQHYPDFEVPFHSRWRHFGPDRLAQLGQALAAASPKQQARSRLDLAIVSVLLDAGAGPQWRYRDGEVTLARSEGLAVASLRAFERGAFSSDPDRPCQVDALRLRQLTQADLAALFQVTADNPLVGLSGRLLLLHQLATALLAQPRRFGTDPARPGNLLDYWLHQFPCPLDAATLLTEVLEGFGSIWPGRAAIADVNLGDVWPHPALPPGNLGANLVPFHKLSQWLTYSLVEPLAAANVEVKHLDALTGLAEYRNGGLCVDLGLLVPKHEKILTQPHRPDAPVVVEWRALTIVMLDLVGDRVRSRLGKSSQELPLIKVLEGGTWAAGRRIARALRSDTGTPPITLQSDGTVF